MATFPRRFRPWLYLALIVPAAHTRVFDQQFQLEVYEVFHTRPAARWGHLLCTPLINVGLLALASQLEWQLDAVAACVALGCYVAVHGALGIAMAPLLALAVLAARLLVEALGAQAFGGTIALVVAATAIQTWTHAAEPVPPPWSGSYRWTSLREFLHWSSLLERVGLAMMLVVFFPILELWAAPRVWPIQIMHLLMRSGLFPERAARIRARVDAIFDDARNGWGGEEA